MTPVESLRARVATFHRTIGWDGRSPIQTLCYWPEIAVRLASLPPDLTVLTLPSPVGPWRVVVNGALDRSAVRYDVACALATRLVHDALPIAELAAYGGAHRHPETLRLALELVAPAWAVRSIAETCRCHADPVLAVAAHLGIRPADADAALAVGWAGDQKTGLYLSGS